MERKVTKTRFSVSISPEMFKKLSMFNNKSKYIELLIYQDLKNIEGIENIII